MWMWSLKISCLTNLMSFSILTKHSSWTMAIMFKAFDATAKIVQRSFSFFKTLQIEASFLTVDLSNPSVYFFFPYEELSSFHSEDALSGFSVAEQWPASVLWQFGAMSKCISHSNTSPVMPQPSIWHQQATKCLLGWHAGQSDEWPRPEWDGENRFHLAAQKGPFKTYESLTSSFSVYCVCIKVGCGELAP